ncbi:hypothetical protein B0H13DRAFT_1868181 [Mycena leptocephala]|nr:hypothetical protein B0H13DRAFT_1868181 [Mycena leptocephala]
MLQIEITGVNRNVRVWGENERDNLTATDLIGVLNMRYPGASTGMREGIAEVQMSMPQSDSKGTGRGVRGIEATLSRARQNRFEDPEIIENRPWPKSEGAMFSRLRDANEARYDDEEEQERLEQVERATSERWWWCESENVGANERDGRGVENAVPRAGSAGRAGTQRGVGRRERLGGAKHCGAGYIGSGRKFEQSGRLYLKIAE